MWGPAPWMGPMSGFWWIFPLIGLLICFLFLLVIARAFGGGGRFMCMGPHHHENAETARLRRELEELREEVKKQAAAR
jgi:hypothetical protein